MPETIEDPIITGWKKPLPIKYIDEELRDLIRVMNMLPGIKTIECCIGHPHKWAVGEEKDVWDAARIWFEVHPDTPLGLFALTRATDRRYWRFGCGWSIELSVGDTMQEGILPTTYCLRSEKLAFGKHVVLTKDWAIVTVRSLIDNLWWHLVSDNGAAFRKYYGLPDGEWWAKHWPKNVVGEMTPEEHAEVERVSLEIDQHFFPEAYALRVKESA